jgi:hypothetical protein
MAGSLTDTFPTSTDGTYGGGNVEVEEGMEVMECVKKEEDVDIKQEEIPEDIPLPGVKSEPDGVSYCWFVHRMKQMRQLKTKQNLHAYRSMQSAPPQHTHPDHHTGH